MRYFCFISLANWLDPESQSPENPETLHPTSSISNPTTCSPILIPISLCTNTRHSSRSRRSSSKRHSRRSRTVGCTWWAMATFRAPRAPTVSCTPASSRCSRRRIRRHLKRRRCRDRAMEVLRSLHPSSSRRIPTDRCPCRRQ